MELQELRVGNYYHWNAEGKDYLYKVEPKDFVRRNYKNFEPVPLTEDWLIKFGFKKYKTKDTFPTYVKNNINVNDGIVYVTGCGFLNHIKHVHQLQDLYRVLTQKELILKD